MAFDQVDTPALIIDLDAFERNLRRMADAVAEHGVRLRPHSKTHKSPIIGRKQMALGAVGVCCQKVAEAEIMVQGGVDDVLVSNQVVGRRKLDRLAALARQARIAVCVDNPDNVRDLAEAATRFGVRIDTLVEIDLETGRCGVEPGQTAVDLAQVVAAQDSLRFAGLQAYQGVAQHIRDYGERRDAIDRAVAMTRDTADRLAEAGLPCDVITGAGTGTFEFEAASGLYTELQAGSYVFMDADYVRNRKADGSAFDRFDHALFVLATVMSRPTRDRAVVDAGHKAISIDSGPPEPHDRDGIRYVYASDEHGTLDVGAANRPPALGETMLFVPGHCDPTANLHDWYVCVRGLGGAKDPVGAHVEAIWPVAARGAMF